MDRSQALFLGGCIPARLALAAAAYFAQGTWATLLGIALAAIAVGFMTIYVMGWRKTGVETQGRPIWWNHLRPVHAVFYGAAATALLMGENAASASLLLADTALGAAAFANRYA